MSGLFGGGSAPPPPPPPAAPPPPPTIDQAKQSRMSRDEETRRKGRAANILAGAGEGMLAEAEQPKTASKTLLGG
jgi:hypothetical protein